MPLVVIIRDALDSKDCKGHSEHADELENAIRAELAACADHLEKWEKTISTLKGKNDE